MAYPLTAVIADLHGNLQALEAALADARSRGTRRFVCLGDVVGYGANPLECLDRVMEICTPEPARAQANGLEAGLCLLGNHEYALLDADLPLNPVAKEALQWTRGKLDSSPRYWDFLRELRPREADAAAGFVHASPREPLCEYLLPDDVRNSEKLRGVFAPMESDVCFVGHSHVPFVYYADGRLFQPRGNAGPHALDAAPDNRAIVNAGSVGQPRDGDPRLSYTLFDGRNLTFVRLEYDVAGAMDAIRAVPALPRVLADRLAVGR